MSEHMPEPDDSYVGAARQYGRKAWDTAKQHPFAIAAGGIMGTRSFALNKGAKWSGLPPMGGMRGVKTMLTSGIPWRYKAGAAALAATPLAVKQLAGWADNRRKGT